MGKQVPALIDAGHRAVTYDRRGFGRSSQPWGPYDFDTPIHKSEENPDGWLDDATVAQLHAGVRSDRLAFLDALFVQYFGVGDRADLVSEAMRSYHVHIAAAASPKATLDCIDSFAYTDFRADMAKVTVPTLVLHSDADALVPFEASGKRTLALVEGSRLALVEGARHGFNTTHAEQFNDALVDFLAR